MRRTLLPRIFLLLAPLLLVCVSGCAGPRLTATSVIHADGSFQRTLRYDADYDVKKEPTRAIPVSVKGSKLEGSFSPPQGAAWTISARQDSEKGREITATRNVATGEPLIGDLGVLTPGVSYSSERIVNRATVTRIAPDRLSYQEVIRWRGPLPILLRKPNTDFRRVVLRCLPESIDDSALIDRITVRIQRNFYSLFLPAEDSASLFSKADASVSDAQQQHEQERWIRQIARDAFRAEVSGTASQTQANRFAASFATLLQRVGPSFKNVDFAAGSGTLSFRADLPGRVVSTNGMIGDGMRHVIWVMPPEAAALHDVTLRAICTMSDESGVGKAPKQP